MSYIITQESFDSLAAYWSHPTCHLRWPGPFVLPVWLKVWWQVFRPEAELYLGAVKQDGRIAGIAPLAVDENRASFLGSPDVCDYFDFIVAPGRETEFFTTLLDDLKQQGIHYLDLGCLRPDSAVLNYLVGIAQNRGYEVHCYPEDTSLELDLPASWDEYLEILTKKQRHEVRRKLRRLAEAGKVDYYFIEDKTILPDTIHTFLKMFIESRQEKANFMTSQRELFFRSLAEAMAEIGLLKFGILELDTLPVAMIMCFDYNGCIYLYNSGYEPQYGPLGVGLLCKVLGIKESIQQSKKKWDFLKGKELYKYHIGGKEIPLSRCQITIK